MAHAQLPQKSPDERAAHVTKTLQKMLNLSSDQASQVNAVFLAQISKMDSLKANPLADKKGDHLTKKGIKLATDQQMMNILSPDQQKQYMQWEKMKEDKEHAKKGGEQAPAPPPAQG